MGEEKALENEPKTLVEEDVEVSAINKMKSRRQKDPKSRRRGLQASTMIANRYDDDEENQDAVSQQCPTASRNVDAGVKPSDEEEDDEKIRQKKEEQGEIEERKVKLPKKQ